MTKYRLIKEYDKGNLSPALFKIYIDDLLRNWKHKADAGIMFRRNLYLNTLFFVHDQVIIQDSEDKFQKSVYILNQMSKHFNLKISTDKTKIMDFKGKYSVFYKIEIDGSILEQVKQFNYLGCGLSLDGKPDFDNKINRFQGDKIRSEVIRKELEISGIQDVRLKYKQNWINHLERMDNTRLPKHAINCKPRGRRDRGRPRKRWQCVDAGTGQTT